MKLSEIAASLPNERLRQLQEHAAWQASPHLKWPETMRDPSCLASALRALPDEAAHVLELIVCGLGAVPFKEEQLLHAARPGTAGAALRVGLLRLVDAGIAFPVRRGWGEKLYMLPAETFFSWHGVILEMRMIQRRSGGYLSEVDELNVVAIDEQGYIPPFSMQMLHAMARMTHEGMKLTGKGVLSKRTIAKGAGQLFVQDHIVHAIVAQPEAGGAEAYPGALRFMLETAFGQQWLVERKGRFQLREEAWSDWLQQPFKERETALFQQFVERMASQSAVVAQGAALLGALAGGRWCRQHEVEAMYRRSQEGLAKPHPSTITAWCTLLRQMGWMELAVDSAANQVVMKWRIQPQSQPQPQPQSQPQSQPQPQLQIEEAQEDDAENLQRSYRDLIQLTPDGDLYVHEHCPYTVRWQLESVAERRRTDYISVYRMEAGSYKRAAMAQYTPDRLTAWIEHLTQEPVSDTVRSMLELGMEAQGQRGMGAELEGIEAKEAKEAKEGNACTGSKAGELPAVSSFSKFVPSPYELIGDSLSLRHLFAGIDEVPSMWMKQFRAYHPTTRRELLDRALTWKTTVKLNCEGVITLFIPERIVEEAGGWAVAGFKANKEGAPAPVTLYPEMWDEMMLVLPVHAGNS